LLGDGTTIANVLRNGPFSAAQSARLIFALLEQRVITLSLGEASPAWRWKAGLADFEAQVGERTPPPPAPPRSVPPPMDPASPPAPQARSIPIGRVDAAPTVEAAPAVPAIAVPTAGGATTRAVTLRDPEAQECLDLAVSAVSLGEISTAIGLLRRGLQLSPRDPEISALLGQLAFRDRQVGQQ
jgi:hypothetical protein